jgi:hypothetical protein
MAFTDIWDQSAEMDQPAFPAPLSACTGLCRSVLLAGALPPVNMPSEAFMRIAPVLLIVWLVIGAIAGGQRHYYSSSDPNCSRAGTITVTILAGPLNYVGVNPKVACKAPQPSS